MTPVAEILLSLMDRSDQGRGLPELLCRQAADSLPVSGAALALLQDSRELDLVTGSDERVVALETVQLDLGEGPCLEAHRRGSIVQVGDLARDGSRWPLYTREMLRRGVRSAASFPLQMGGIHLGVLDLVRDEPGSLDAEELALALTFADAAVLILLHLHGLGSPSERPTDPDDHTADPLSSLSSAFHGHAEVHQATGMVSVQAGVDLTEALLLIRAHAFAEGRSIMDVSRDIVSRSLRLAPE